MAAAERSTNDDAKGFVGEEEDEASRVGDLYGALNVETTATSIEVRFLFFPFFFLCLKKPECDMRAKNDDASFYVSLRRRVSSLPPAQKPAR